MTRKLCAVCRAIAATVIFWGCAQSREVSTPSGPPRGMPAHERLPLLDTIPICVIRGDSLDLVSAVIVRETGDTLVDGVPFSQRYANVSPPYAASAAWFAENQPINFGGRWYYGGNHPPQTISRDLLALVGHYSDVPIYAEMGDSLPEILYVPIRPGCVFQSYIGIQSGPGL